MSRPIIEVEDISKCYRLGAIGATTLRETFEGWGRSLGGKAAPKDRNEFWALRGVSFSVEAGDMVGIIGRNGAGKSTLLKILSRITEPTSGRAVLRGRVASLLEVGTGFHPDLSGRENIFLNGAILGMTREEIRRKFDEIVAFAEVEQFIDTPVKRYSSGMYVRLAFAVAAHLEPEILIVDEVLAVGDVQFQNKCMGKMEDVSSHGRTVLFVSHDMGNVSKLCRRGILLNAGKVELQGDMPAVVGRYLREDAAEEGRVDLRERGDRSGSGEARLLEVELLQGTTRTSLFPFGKPLTVRAAIDVKAPLGNAHLAVSVLTSEGIAVLCLENANENLAWTGQPGIHEFEVTLPEVSLFPGNYVIDLWIGNHQRARVDYIKRAVGFQVVQTTESGLQVALNRRDGLVFARSTWKLHRR